MSVKLKLLVTITLLILLIVSFLFLWYGIGYVIDSKKESDSKKSKILLASGIIDIIVGGGILLIEMFIGIILFLRHQYNIDLLLGI